MRKHRLIILVLSVLGCVTTYSQTQEGYVKTLGRPNKKGTALSGVSIKVKGEHNPVKSNDDGVFTIQFQNKKKGDAYTLQEVRKIGYELNEPEIVGRHFAVSDKVKNTIVMISTAQLQADMQRIENNAYKVAEKNYMQKLALLEMEKDAETMDIETYRNEIQDLQDKFEKHQSLIGGLAEHYAHVDYDELSESEREINICIENGKLEQADSLLQIVFDPVEVLKKNLEALSKIDQRIIEAYDMMRQANVDMLKVLKRQKKDAEYLYHLYTIALARFDYEKAEKYLMTRMELDTLNADWNYDFIKYAIVQRKYDVAKACCLRLISIHDAQPQENNMHLVGKSVAYNSLGVIYSNINKPHESAEYYMKAIELQRQLFTQYPFIITSYARSVGNLSNLLMQDGQFDRSRELLTQAKSIFEDVLKIDSVRFRVEYAKVLFALGKTYVLNPYEVEKTYDLNIYEVEKGEKILLNALDIIRKAEELDQEGQQMIGRILLDLGYAYSLMSDSLHAEKCLDEAIDYFSRLYAQNSNANVRELYTALVAKGNYLYEKRKMEKAKACYEQAIKILSPYTQSYPSIYTELTHALNGLGIIYLNQGYAEDGKIMFEKALEVARIQVNETRRKEQSLFATLVNLGYINMSRGEFLKAEQSFKEAIAINRKLYQGNKNKELAKVLFYLGMLYMQDQSGRNTKCEDLLTEASDVYEKFYNQNDSELKALYLNILQFIGYISLTHSNYPKTDSAYSKLLFIIKNDKDIPIEHNGLYDILNNMSFVSIMLKKYHAAEQYAREALALDTTKHLTVTNLAASLLFQGKYSEAEKLYRHYREELKDHFFDDFKQFTEAGAVPKKREKDVEKIKQLLNK